MSIYLSNDLYLGTQPNNGTGFMRGAPLIGWKSVLRPADIVSSVVRQNGQAAWSPTTYDFWRSDSFMTSGGSTHNIYLYNTTSSPVSYIGIAGHNFFRNSYGEPFSIQVSALVGSEWVVIVPAFTPSSGNALMLVFDETYAPQFRVAISEPIRSTEAPFNFELAHIRMGPVTRLQRRVYVGVRPLTLDKRTTKLVSVSDGGKYLGGVLQSVTNSYALDQPDNRPDFYRAEIDPFLDHAELIRGWGNGPLGTFFCAWRPLEYPREVLYCHPPSEVRRAENQRPNGMVQWSISGEGESWLNP